MSDDAARSDASAREPEPAASPVPSDQASDDRSAQETAEVSAPGNNQSGESDDTQPDAKSPAHDDDAAEATKKRKRSPEPEAADPATTTAADAPPLPTDELPPPLPDEEPPAQQDDGWEALWDHNVGAYYFYNRHTGVTQWENPRVPDATSSSAVPAPPGTSAYGNSSLGSPPRKRAGGYNPAIHDAYAQTANFNRFTGRFQASTDGPEQHNDENKSRRQLNAYFDVDAAANSHDGRSLKAERQNKRLSKKELQAFKAKAAKKKEEKRRAWLRD
ncbi:WW/Rsp5/WWP [Lasiodiplodia theobromae]|nr:WW/Rsp5/WWP [Lasiodiplodia theobromae]